MSFYSIRDDIHNIFLLKKYFNENNISRENIEELIGEAIIKKNSIAISLINLYILENNIKIPKNGIFKGIYYAGFSEEYKRVFEEDSTRIECALWNDELFGEYYERYNYIFKIHDKKDRIMVNLESAKKFLHNYSIENINNIDIFEII